MSFKYTIRKPNHQNDRIWAYRRKDVEDVLTWDKMARPVCIALSAIKAAQDGHTEYESPGHIITNILSKNLKLSAFVQNSISFNLISSLCCYLPRYLLWRGVTAQIDTLYNPSLDITSIYMKDLISKP